MTSYSKDFLSGLTIKEEDLMNLRGSIHFANLKRLRLFSLLISMLCFFPGIIYNVYVVLKNDSIADIKHFYQLVVLIALSVILTMFYFLSTYSERFKFSTLKYLVYIFAAVIFMHTCILTYIQMHFGYGKELYQISLLMLLVGFYWRYVESSVMYFVWNIGYSILIVNWGKYAPEEAISYIMTNAAISGVFLIVSFVIYQKEKADWAERNELKRNVGKSAFNTNEQLFDKDEKLKELEEMVKQLIEAKEKAEKNTDAKAEFLSTMSHEIRTQMTAINGVSLMLMEENPRPDQLEHIQTLRYSAKNLLVLINDILDFSKIEAGKITFEDLDFSLKDLIEHAKQSFAFQAVDKGVTLKFMKDSDVPDMLVGDPVRLSQVLSNLISNAIKFTKDGVVKVDVMLNKQKGSMVSIDFSVTDTGIGIPTHRLEDIFESFSQASSDTTRKFGGTGLGLTITKRLLEMQQSKIRVESEEGKGSRFYFTLQFQVSKKTEKSSSSFKQFSPKLNSLKGVKILLVDDNTINSDIATKILEKWKAEVEYVENGQEAIDKVKSTDYDIVLMDLQMPVMDGIEATKIIRKIDNSRFASLPILALTASAMTEERERVFEAGMDDFVTKPIENAELYSKIAKFVRRTVASLDKESQQGNEESEMVNEEVEEATDLLSFGEYLAVADGDNEFFKKLVQKTIDQLEEFRENYQKALNNKDLKAVSRANHKLKPGLIRLKALRLLDEMEEGKAIIIEGRNAALVHQNMSKINSLVDKAKHELRQQIN
ncbi:response regulator [Flammeovirgaceae bacterium SG7u.111]|nr:response regulator [Flammeovirgaceae bacterium SG7u.132]WPO37335.1 response regulator [Flammeovirgaceae bacterium SG7u.111]